MVHEKLFWRNCKCPVDLWPPGQIVLKKFHPSKNPGNTEPACIMGSVVNNFKDSDVIEFDISAIIMKFKRQLIAKSGCVSVLCEWCSGVGSIHFFQFNSIPIQVGFRIFQFNSIPIQIRFRIFQFNSNSIHFLSIQIQFNSNFMHRDKQMNKLTGWNKFYWICSLGSNHRFSQKWQLRVCKWNFRVCKMALLMKIPMKMKELWIF